MASKAHFNYCPYRPAYRGEAKGEGHYDPELLDEVRRSRLDMDPNTGEEVEAVYNELMDQPAGFVDLLKKDRGELKKKRGR